VTPGDSQFTGWRDRHCRRLAGRRAYERTVSATTNIQFSFYRYPARAGVVLKGDERQLAQSCLIALRLWRKFPLAKWRCVETLRRRSVEALRRALISTGPISQPNLRR